MWGWLAKLVGSGAGQAAGGQALNLGMGMGGSQGPDMSNLLGQNPGGNYGMDMSNVMGTNPSLSTGTPGGFGSRTEGGVDPNVREADKSDLEAEIKPPEMGPNITPDVSEKHSSPGSLFAMANQMEKRGGKRRPLEFAMNKYLTSLMGG